MLLGLRCEEGRSKNDSNAAWACDDHDDGDLYARRDEEIKDGAFEHASAGVIITAARSLHSGAGGSYIAQDQLSDSYLF